ncbi:hypothetical protein D9619_005013 [Psilocybe cf. subviscida]|uniref:Uncharacterized protein n=1 Tax=Psilocybe cf. subviscida TaxID=2480587 RepID=A0A8H5F8Q3_9AGAR|nr:hypothetical protein D9619_005013 [Psilocybe cf. subviscida]
MDTSISSSLSSKKIRRQMHARERFGLSDAGTDTSISTSSIAATGSTFVLELPTDDGASEVEDRGRKGAAARDSKREEGETWKGITHQSAYKTIRSL